MREADRQRLRQRDRARQRVLWRDFTRRQRRWRTIRRALVVVLVLYGLYVVSFTALAFMGTHGAGHGCATIVGPPTSQTLPATDRAVIPCSMQR